MKANFVQNSLMRKSLFTCVAVLSISTGVIVTQQDVFADEAEQTTLTQTEDQTEQPNGISPIEENDNTQDIPEDAENNQRPTLI